MPTVNYEVYDCSYYRNYYYRVCRTMLVNMSVILKTSVTKGSRQSLEPDSSYICLISTIYGYYLPLLDGKLKISLCNFGDTTSY
jgi:hypothetical protein